MNHRIVTVGLCLLLSVFAVASSFAAELQSLPRKYGPLKLAMTLKEFKRATDVDAAGQCFDCIKDQNTKELDAKYFAQILDDFPTIARGEASEDAQPTVFFYKGRLEFILLIVEQYDRATVLAALEQVLGKDYKRQVFPKKCIYAGGESFTWSDADTSIILTEYGDTTGSQLELKFADRQLLEEAESMQEAGRREITAELEEAAGCPK
jgi:hypothetical protein